MSGRAKSEQRYFEEVFEAHKQKTEEIEELGRRGIRDSTELDELYQGRANSARNIQSGLRRGYTLGDPMIEYCFSCLFHYDENNVKVPSPLTHLETLGDFIKETERGLGEVVVKISGESITTGEIEVGARVLTRNHQQYLIMPIRDLLTFNPEKGKWEKRSEIKGVPNVMYIPPEIISHRDGIGHRHAWRTRYRDNRTTKISPVPEVEIYFGELAKAELKKERVYTIPQRKLPVPPVPSNTPLKNSLI